MPLLMPLWMQFRQIFGHTLPFMDMHLDRQWKHLDTCLDRHCCSQTDICTDGGNIWTDSDLFARAHLD